MSSHTLKSDDSVLENVQENGSEHQSSYEKFLSVEMILQKQLKNLDKAASISNDVSAIQSALSMVFQGEDDLQLVLVELKADLDEAEYLTARDRARALFESADRLGQFAKNTMSELRRLELCDKESTLSAPAVVLSHMPAVSKKVATVKKTMVGMNMARLDAGAGTSTNMDGGNVVSTNLVLQQGKENTNVRLSNAEFNVKRYMDSLNENDVGKNMQASLHNGKNGNSSLSHNSAGSFKHTKSSDSCEKCSHRSSVSDKLIADLVLTNQKLVSSQRLPVSKPMVFYGDEKDFPNWESSIDAVLNNPHVNANDKWTLLKDHLGERPLKVIKGLMVNRTEDTYRKARDRLKSRYGNESVITKAFTESLIN